MENVTIKKLSAMGWIESRSINIALYKKRYEEIGLEMPHNIEEFLATYGMLKSNAKDKIYFEVDFDPIKAIGSNLSGDYFRECLGEYGIDETVYPIGVVCKNNLLLLMNQNNVCYCFTDGCLLKVGDNVQEMLDCLVGECRLAEEIE